MLGFVQNWFGPRSSPIGIDFGTDCLRLAQVHWEENDWRLTAAASADVPSDIRSDSAARAAFFTQAIRDLLVSGKFRGRTAVLGLPAAAMFIQHMRFPKMDEADLKKSLPWEARGKLPIDPSHALLRHLIAGDVYVDQEPRQEIILLAAERQIVDDLLAAAKKARLDVAGMNIEPLALLDCFTQVYRRAADSGTTYFFVDIGAVGSRAILSRGRQVLFARAIEIGGDHFTSAVADALKISNDDARSLRFRLCTAAEAQAASERTMIAPGAPEVDTQRVQVEQAVAPLVSKLVGELELCRRYYDATFPGKPVDRLVFVGGESRQRGLCQEIAKGLGLPAQVGDPLCRMSKRCDVGLESGIDRRLPQPAWAVAIGLSMGPPKAHATAAAGTETRSTNGSANGRA